jgi:hypothetical protein
MGLVVLFSDFEDRFLLQKRMIHEVTRTNTNEIFTIPSFLQSVLLR